MSETTLRCAAVQLNSGMDVGANLSTIRDLVAEAAARGAELVVLPESSIHYGETSSHVESDDGPSAVALSALARELGIWLHDGSTPRPAPGGRAFNETTLYAPDGSRAASYRKLHLFDVDLPDGIVRRESDRIAPGDALVVADADGWSLGLTICYDLRFPELYRRLAIAGADILTIPAAFSSLTGPAHWEPLLRSRAIENQCYVIAAAQTGASVGRGGAPKRCHGETMIVDPWGTVVARLADEVGLVLWDADRREIGRARERVPSLAHRRADVYG